MTALPRLPAALPAAWRGETYHDRPVVKASGFDWKVSTYIVIVGIAGSAQLIAGIAGRSRGMRSTVRHARLLAAAGSVVGPLVLIQHLKTPSRWYNMLRIVRPTSPMSLGSWLLTAFGGLSGLLALAELLGSRWPFARRAADLAQVPASVAGAGMSVYTAGLLASTSTPLWAAAPAGLAAQFGASSMAGAAAALALAGRVTGEDDDARRLERLATAAAAAEFVASAATGWRWRRAGVASPVETGEAAALHRGGRLVGMVAPVAAGIAGRAMGGRAGSVLPVATSLAIIVGGAMLRHAILRGGNAGARQPRDAFGVTQRVRR